MVKRISITPEPDVEAVLIRLSNLDKVPKATIINDFLRECYPAFVLIAEAKEAIRDKTQVQTALSNLLLAASGKIIEGAALMIAPDKKEIDDNLHLAL